MPTEPPDWSSPEPNSETHVVLDPGAAANEDKELAAIAAELGALNTRLAGFEKPTITNYELADVEGRVAKLEESGRLALEESVRQAREEELDRAKKISRLTLLTSVCVLALGALLILGTMVLGAETITGEADALSTGEFVAGVAAGCVLVLAVVALAAVRISNSPRARGSL